MKTRVTIKEYDHITDQIIGDIVEIKDEYIDAIKNVAGVEDDDLYIAYCYPLTYDNLIKICEIINFDVIINSNSSYYLEGHAV